MKKLLPEMKLLTVSMLCFGLLMASPAHVLAQETNQVEEKKWFSIEVVFFLRDREAANQERWPLPEPQVSEIDTSESIETPLNLPEAQNETIPMKKADFQLGKMAYSINRDPALKVVSHQGWLFTGKAKSDAPWLTLQTKNQDINSKIRISLARFLHADVDISFPNPAFNPSFDIVEQGVFLTAPDIHFTASRRLRTKELHYIDHPLAGILIQAQRSETPFNEKEEPEISPETQQDTQSQAANSKS